MSARPVSSEYALAHSLALHRFRCVDRLSSFGDISVISLVNILRSSATGQSVLTSQCLVCVARASSRSTCLGVVLTTAAMTRGATRVCCSAYLRLASVRCSRYAVLAESREKC